MAEWLEPARWQNYSYCKEIVPRVPQMKQEEARPQQLFVTWRWCLVWRRWPPWLSRGMGTGRGALLSLRRSQCSPALVRPFVFAAPKILIFLASAFVLAEHHQEGDRTKVRVQVCLVP